MEIIKTTCETCFHEKDCKDKNKYTNMVKHMIQKTKEYEETEGEISKQMTFHCRMYGYKKFYKDESHPF